MSSEPEKKVDYEFLDRESELDISERNLPHWFQPGKAVFVTFRTHDSVPKKIADQWRREIQSWLEKNNLSLDLISSGRSSEQIRSRYARANSLSDNLKIDFKKLRIKLWNQKLDECHGACLLKRPPIAKIVSDTILLFDSDRYDVDCFVIMPNHVHAIVQFKDKFDLATIGQSWMRFSAREINRLMNLKGPFWQSEPFDHVIRNENQFRYLQKYIEENPRKANLKPGEFVYWKRQE